MSSPAIRVVTVQLAVPVDDDRWMDALSDMRDDSKGAVLQWGHPDGSKLMSFDVAARHFDSDPKAWREILKHEKQHERKPLR